MSVTQKINGVDAVFEILQDAKVNNEFTAANPELFKLFEISTQERENNPNPALYVWSPTETSFERFSADGNRLIRNGSVEIIVATLDASVTVALSQDTVDVLGDFIGDHHDKTELRTVEPESATDDRASTVFRHTDHYTGTVSVSSQVLQQVA